MKDRWKRYFFISAGVNAFLALLIISLIIWLVVVPNNKIPDSEPRKITSEPVFTVNAEKKQLAQIINGEIDQHPTGNLSFYVEMNKTFDIIGNLEILGLKVPFKMSFTPSVQDGEILLKEESAKLGRINLPESQVLKFIQSGADLPEWVVVHPDKKEIEVRIRKMLIKDRFFAKAKAIDLANNKLIFDIYRYIKE